MRRVNYVVGTADGKIFSTTSYAEAHKDGNHVISTVLTKVDERTEAYKEYGKYHAKKIAEILNFKWAL
jgi:hypothetical protein